MSDSDLGSIRITNLAVNLGGLQVLHDVNLTADRGDLLALLGPNGAGKTTILRTMLGLVRPARGSVTVAGAAPGRGWRHVGYVPQRSVQAIKKLVDVDKVFAVVGTSGSSHLVAMMPTIEENQIPAINFAAVAGPHFTPPRKTVFNLSLIHI